ncbi:ESX secretion-associated protein EspG [Actinophytocola glycyrrhizae]|uniref:ESX secretion-associated protein EspG n=1 Tax=Actinophytocola glycyrrhizae TaxID=2044873 RepID=A0ABV9S7F3_9PSEU
MVTASKLQSTTLWPPIALVAWQEMWRMYSSTIPMPVVLDLPRTDGVRSAADRNHEALGVHAALVASGYAVREGSGVRLSRDARAMLRVLARPSREVDLRMDIRGESVRALAAVPRSGDVVRVSIHEYDDIRRSAVVVESVRTSAPALAAVDLLPDSPGPGRIRALSVPLDQLERAIDGYRTDRFIDTLKAHIGSAAGDVQDLLRRGHTMRAKFGLAALNRDGRRARHPSAVMVHDSTAGRHVLAQRGEYLTIDRVNDHQVAAMLEQRLAEQVDGRC